MPVKAKVSKAVKAYVKKQLDVQVEDKVYITRQVNPAGAGGNVQWTTGSFQTLSNIAQGDVQGSRNGSRVTAKKLRIDYSAQAGTTDSVIRMIVFQDKAMDAVQPIANQIFGTGDSGTISRPLAQFDPDRVPGRFHILADRCFKLSLAGDTNHTGRMVIRKKLIKNLYFDDATTTLGSNCIYCLLLSDQATGGATVPGVNVTSSLFFEDA